MASRGRELAQAGFRLTPGVLCRFCTRANILLSPKTVSDSEKILSVLETCFSRAEMSLSATEIIAWIREMSGSAAQKIESGPKKVLSALEMILSLSL